MGVKAGKEAAHGVAEGFTANRILLEHIGTIVGRAFGMTGVGTAFLSGGFVGSGLMIGLHLLMDFYLN